MISLRYFLLILLTLCCRESVASAELFDPDAVTTAASIGCLVFCFALIAKLAAVRAMDQSQINGARFDWLAREYFLNSRMKIERVWCWLSPVVMLLSGCFGWTVELQQAGWAQSIVLMICFAPTIAFLMAMEFVSAQLDQIGKVEAQKHTVQTWLVRLRLGEVAGLMMCLIPVFLMASVSDLSEVCNRLWSLNTTVVSSVLTGCMGVLFVLLFPAVLTRMTGGRALPEPLAERVRQLIDKTGVRGTKASVICSNGRWAGAAIVGWVRGFRRLWLGDGLIAHLTPKEIDMVVLHEMAHVARYHFVWRLFPVIWSLGAGVIIWMCAEQFGLSELVITKIFAAAASSLLLLGGLGNLARRCELDADRTACELALTATAWSQETSPAQVLGSALSKLLEGSGSKVRTWLHPSLEQRLDSLKEWDLSRGPSTEPTSGPSTEPNRVPMTQPLFALQSAQ